MGASYIIPDIFPNGKRVFVFAACRQRGAFGWTCGPGEVLAETCQLVLFRPHASYLRKEARCRASAKKLLFTLARKYTRVCGPLCDPMGSRHEVSNHWGKLLRFLPALSLWSAIANRFAVRTTIRLPSSRFGSLSPPQGIFALQKSLRGDCGGDGVPSAVGSGTASAKKFPEEICFAPRRVLQICRTPRLAITQKYVTTPDWSHVRVGQPPGARGTAVPLFREASRGTPSKGFLWATSSRKLDTALLFADKKRGVETYQAGRALPVETGACRHARQ